MAGRHLRRSPGPAPRTVLGVLGTFLLGAVLGVGGAFVVDDDERVAAGPVPQVRRDPPGVASLTPDPGPVTLAFVGDVSAERSLAARLADDPTGFVGPFADTLHAADLVVANVEAAITNPGVGEALDKEYVFRAPPAILDALAAGGVDLASAANNHGIDFGAEGLADTLRIAAARDDGMLIGIGVDEDAAYAPRRRVVGGHAVSVIAATHVLDADRIRTWTAGPDQAGVASAKRVDRLVEEVAAAGARDDVVVVYLHWGIEAEECPSVGQKELARALVDAGADVVVGTHAHRVQGGGRLDGAVVHYGLGNFLFGAVSEASARTGVFLVEVDPGGAGDEVATGYEWVPGRIDGFVPEPLEGDEAATARAEWEGRRACTGLDP